MRPRVETGCWLLATGLGDQARCPLCEPRSVPDFSDPPSSVPWSSQVETPRVRSGQGLASPRPHSHSPSLSTSCSERVPAPAQPLALWIAFSQVSVYPGHLGTETHLPKGLGCDRSGPFTGLAEAFCLGGASPSRFLCPGPGPGGGSPPGNVCLWVLLLLAPWAATRSWGMKKSPLLPCTVHSEVERRCLGRNRPVLSQSYTGSPEL